MLDGSVGGPVKAESDTKLDWNRQEETNEVSKIDSLVYPEIDDGRKDGDHRENHREEKDGHCQPK